MSDDDLIIDEVLRSNAGVTLPGDKNATNNISLSPIFFGRSGRGGSKAAQEYVITSHGRSGFLWSSNARPDISASYSSGSISDVQSSASWERNVAMSLRCLVSTNNK